jgi:hypothetical protein
MQIIDIHINGVFNYINARIKIIILTNDGNER